MADGLFSSAPYRSLSDPLDRLLGYIDFRAAMLKYEIPQYTCLLGTMVQETYLTHPAIRQACDRHMSAHTAQVAQDIEEARKLYAPDAAWSAESLAFYTQAVLQGSFILAKVKQSSTVAAESIAHLRNHIETLFKKTQAKAQAKTQPKPNNQVTP